MKFTARISVTAGLLVLLASTVGCDKLKARDQLNKGIASFKNNQYEDAANHFQNSIRLDPTYTTAKLYLATSYAYQVVPNLDTADNMAIAKKAIDGFQEVLTNNPNDLTALKQVATIYRNIKKYPEAKEYEHRLLVIDPNDAEANYTVGVVDWVESYNNTQKLLMPVNKVDDGLGNIAKSKQDCATIQQENTDLVKDGIDSLEKAVQIRPNYDDAMQYLNLMYRRKADIDCGPSNDAARKADIAAAEDWSKKAMGARKVNEAAKEAKYGGGVKMDQ